MDPTNSRNQRYTLGDFLSMYGRLTQYQAKQARDVRIKGLSHVSELPEGAPRAKPRAPSSDVCQLQSHSLPGAAGTMHCRRLA